MATKIKKSNSLLEQLQNKIYNYRNHVDYLEIRLEQSESTAISFYGLQLNTINSHFSLAGSIRACYKGGWSFVTFNDISELSNRIEEAISHTYLVGKKTTQLAPIEPIQDYVAVKFGRDPRDISLEEKRQLIETYNQLLLDFDPRIQATNVSYSDRFTITYFVNSIGSCIAQERLDVNGKFRAMTCGEGSLVKQGIKSISSRTDYNTLCNIDKQVIGAAEQAIRQLEAKPVKGGQYTVLLDPYMAGVFIHEAFGHLSEADSIYENSQMEELLKLDKPIGTEKLNVVDDATIDGLSGSIKYDDEGVPGQRKYLVKNGVLTAHLHNRETAGKMREVPTGNARAINAMYPPIVRMTNTAIEIGDRPVEEMVQDIDRGVYAIGTLGGQTNGEMFTFAATEGYMIRNGKIAEAVSDVTLTGNVFQTLKDIEAIGNDFTYSNGNCGKSGQAPLPVSIGSPHLMIKNVVVGGH
ncbi:MAG: TldD/PmbA family protein [Okeania sp. SIO3B5]|uniref:TldD/PmbA family protein n=1 Tax=Okeania sp. SIO3B5 TaxID=2607811 RepID=UPI0013FFBEE3|nr:TldD/PmbA family protein [Okeania sp. SIO3B5]NEO57071.1 TldD/PmbA family protein [Okeania sp. SIO3B5]